VNIVLTHLQHHTCTEKRQLFSKNQIKDDSSKTKEDDSVELLHPHDQMNTVLTRLQHHACRESKDNLLEKTNQRRLRPNQRIQDDSPHDQMNIMLTHLQHHA
jgi:hypothetical protein